MAVTVTAKPAASADDALHKWDTWDWSLDYTVTYAAMGGMVSGNIYDYGCRFINVTVPKDAIITAAKVTFTADEDDSGAVHHLKIDGEPNATPATFSDLANYDARTRTTAKVDWDDEPSWSAESTYDSADITSVIQEIVNLAGWVSGCNLVLFFEDDGSTSIREGYSYDGSVAKCPVLSVTFASTTTEPKYPQSATTAAEDPWLDDDWVSPTNIYADDTNYASVTSNTYDATDQTYVLKAYNFDFSAIPADATILGVTCVVSAWTAAAKVQSLDLCQLLDTAGAKVGTNLAATPIQVGVVEGGTLAPIGGASNLWGNVLTPVWVKNSNFGVALGFISGTDNSDIFVDYVTLEVVYQLAAASAWIPKVIMVM